MQLGKKKIISWLVPVFISVLVIFSGAKSILAQHEASKSEEEKLTIVAATAQNQVTEEINHATDAHGEEKVDAGKLIMEHITDAYDWHIATIGHKHISIPLPVIIKDDNGIHVFLSSKFEHGHASYKGYKLEHNKIVAENGNDFLDLSMTKNVTAMLIAVLTLLFIMLSVAKSYKNNGNKAPKGLQAFIEPLIIFLRDEVAKPSIGPKYQKFLPFLLTIFFFIFINNLFGLVPFFPGGANVTGNIAVTMVLAIFTFVITSINGNKSYWGHIFLPPGVPKVLWILLIPIEIIGMFNKPIVLMIRLFANITAGHIIILGFFSLIFIFGAVNASLGLGVSVLSVAFTVFMSMLELLVAFLQAYVFTLLSALYFGSAVEEHHHAEEHH
ncbi:MAG: F0F1 ATP synthase subunit A [Bacteroidia bacterium]